MWKTLAKTVIVLAVITGLPSCKTYETARWEPSKLPFSYQANYNNIKDDLDGPIGEPPEKFEDRLELVKDLNRKAFRIPVNENVMGLWLPPETTEAVGGVCIGVSLWLYDALHEHGFDNVRVAMGRRYEIMHAWIEWDSENGEYIIDPSFNFIARTGSKTHYYEPMYCIYNGRTYED